jgi:hypothetical protein
VTGRKPIVPAELRQLLALMRDLSEPLPSPARGPDGMSADGAWRPRRIRELCRDSVLRTRLYSLVAQLEIGNKYPLAGADCLAEFCQAASCAIWERFKAMQAAPQPSPSLLTVVLRIVSGKQADWEAGS